MIQLLQAVVLCGEEGEYKERERGRHERRGDLTLFVAFPLLSSSLSPLSLFPFPLHTILPPLSTPLHQALIHYESSSLHNNTYPTIRVGGRAYIRPLSVPHALHAHTRIIHTTHTEREREIGVRSIRILFALSLSHSNPQFQGSRREIIEDARKRETRRKYNRGWIPWAWSERDE